jgi:RNA polymerase sigma factor (sigma-70 family)
MGTGVQTIASRHLETLLSAGAIGSLTDAELLALFTSRQDQAAELAFVTIVERHGSMVLGICRAILRDPHDAEDAFQSTFVVLVKEARTLWIRDSLAPWLYRVAQRTSSCSRSAIIRRRRHERNAAASIDPVAEAVGAYDLGEVLQTEVARLPTRYRAAIVLCLIEGLTPQQAARRLGWPVGSVHSRLARGRQRLRSQLSRRGFAPSVIVAGLQRMTDTAGALSPVLTAATVQAATRLAAGESLGLAVSASVAALVNESLRTQMFLKLMTAGTAIVVLGGIAIGAVAFGYQVTLPELTASPSQHKAKAEPVQAHPAPVRKMEVRQPEGGAVSLAISADGKTLAASCTDGVVRLVDAQTGETRITLPGLLDKGVVGEIVFTPDGKTLIGATAGNRIGCWNVSTGDLRQLAAAGEMPQSSSPRITTNALAISPDGALIAVGGGGSATPGMIKPQESSSSFELRVLSATTGSLMWSHLGRTGYVVQLAFSPDGKTLASATYGPIRLWDAGTGDLTQTLKPKAGSVWALAFSPDNKLIAGYGMARSGDEKKSILTLWDASSGAILQSIEAGPASASIAPGTLAFSPDGRSIAGAGVGIKEGPIMIAGKPIGNVKKLINYVKLWDVATGARLWTSAEGGQGQVKALLFSPDGNSLFCCDQSATTRIDAQTGQVRQDLLKAAVPGTR